jgi:DNA-binding MarR family transcriptional regulator
MTLKEKEFSVQALDTIDRALGGILKHGIRGNSQMAQQVGLQGGSSLNASAFPILSELATTALRPSELADQTGSGRPATSRQVQQLEREGLVRRVQDEFDRRGSVLELTPRGRTIAQMSVEVRRAELQRVLAEWPEEEVLSLARLLARLQHDMEHRVFGAGE